MKYGYIRVSSDKQTVENQRFEITKYCEAHGIVIDGWIEETISGTKSPDKRKLGRLLKKIKTGDMIFCSEISRLGRSLYMIMEILAICMEKGVTVQTIKDNFCLKDDIQSKVLAFAFGLSAEIERDLISQRTKEALAVRRANGQKLGRPQGHINKSHKLDGKMPLIIKMLDKGISKRRIAKQLRVSTPTLYDYLENNSKTEITSVIC